MKFSIDGKYIDIGLLDDLVEYDNSFLLYDDDDLSEDCFWQSKGFVVTSLLDDLSFDILHKYVANSLKNALIKAGSEIEGKLFELDRYHEYCRDQSTHIKVIELLRSSSFVENLPIDHRVLDKKASQACGKLVSCKVAGKVASGYFFIRIVRPLPFQDYNPPHKDAWLDRLRNGLNMYLPLAGSDENSSLPLVPGSHLWSESETPRTRTGAQVNGIKYSVPAVAIKDAVLEMTRPEVKRREAMFFSPYIIHGGAVNFNSDKTRVSIEMRFWRS